MSGTTPEVDGWRTYPLTTSHVAVETNLVSLRRVTKGRDARKPVTVEKVEVHVDYKD